MIARSGFPAGGPSGAVRGQPPVVCNPREPELRVSQTSPYRGRSCNCQHPVFPGLDAVRYVADEFDVEAPLYGGVLQERTEPYRAALMIRQILARPQWIAGSLAIDNRALSPLIWEREQPYRRYELDSDTCVLA
jgi:hypothetical protein